MRITFLIPPILVGDRATERVAGCTYTLYPVPNIYELTVAAVIEQAGHEVRYVECVLNNWKKKEFEDFLWKDDSDAYSIYTVNLGIENDLIALGLIRKYRGNTPVVFMGPAPTYFPEKFLSDEHSYVVRGEPDYTARDLVNYLDSGKTDPSEVQGVSFYKGGEIVANQSRELIKDLDELPFAARHLIDPTLQSLFSNPKLKLMPYTSMVSSRNCPFKCIYCVPSSLSFARELEYKREHERKPPVGMRSVENIVAEIHHLGQQGYRAISFQDDNFIWTAKRLRPIAQALKEYNIIWGCQSRADLINEEICEILVETGCKYVDIGVESFDQNILDYVKKGLKVEDLVQAIKLLKKHNITAKINVLLGTSPLETKETIRKNMRYIRELDIDQVMFSITNPFPGTEFYDLAQDNNWFINGDYSAVDVQKNALLNLPHLTSRQLEKEVNRCNRHFYLNPRFILKNITKFDSFSDFKTASKALYRKLM